VESAASSSKKLRDDASLQFVGIGARPAQHERIRALFNDTPVFTAPGALIRLKPDLVVECASHSHFVSMQNQCLRRV
jgi:hypothetical protein